MSDTIYRQAAIDELCKRCDLVADEDVPCTEKCNDIKILEMLPSAQPDIIRCKDCKYWLPHYQLGFDEDNDEYHDYCERLIPDDEYYAFYRDADDFCSRAERKNNDE